MNSSMTLARQPSFVAETEAGAGYWTPDRSGDWGTQNARGRGYAEDLLTMVRETGNPAYLGAVIRAIVAGGVYGGVEVGFCHRLGVELVGMMG